MPRISNWKKQFCYQNCFFHEVKILAPFQFLPLPNYQMSLGERFHLEMANSCISSSILYIEDGLSFYATLFSTPASAFAFWIVDSMNRKKMVIISINNRSTWQIQSQHSLLPIQWWHKLAMWLLSFYFTPRQAYFISKTVELICKYNVGWKTIVPNQR